MALKVILVDLLVSFLIAIGRCVPPATSTCIEGYEHFNLIRFLLLSVISTVKPIQ
jgi:hypothetical protein